MNTEQFSRVQQAYDRQEPETFDDDALCCNCRQEWSKHVTDVEVDVNDDTIMRFLCDDNSGSEFEELTDEMMAEEAAEQRMNERYGR